MAGKSRRVAARQAQLNRRRKKQQRGPSGIPAATRPESAAPEAEAEPQAAVATAEAAPVAEARAAASSVPYRPPTRARPAASSRELNVPAAQYIGPEIKRIVAMASTAFAVLVVLKLIL